MLCRVRDVIVVVAVAVTIVGCGGGVVDIFRTNMLFQGVHNIIMVCRYVPPQ